MTDPRWLDDREQCLWRTWRQMHIDLTSALDRELARDSGLSGADYAILVPLSESPDGRLRARELRTEAKWDRSRLAHQLRRMEQRGLIVREDCDEDARGTMARLTPAGREAIEMAAPGHVAAVRRYFVDHLSDEEIDTLRSVADRVLARIRAAETA
ncbi:MarR family winged helix-turn-helix transcriptional regulator [Stackebrandtia nassauensis]|nr:MarR family transcriptional regulator [Stackebrandtia nassauensis]